MYHLGAYICLLVVVGYRNGEKLNPHGDGELRRVGAGEPQDLGHARDPAGRGARDPSALRGGGGHGGEGGGGRPGAQGRERGGRLCRAGAQHGHINGETVHPTFLYESLWCLSISPTAAVGRSLRAIASSSAEAEN